jgi:hypothetical protein
MFRAVWERPVSTLRMFRTVWERPVSTLSGCFVLSEKGPYQLSGCFVLSEKGRYKRCPDVSYCMRKAVINAVRMFRTVWERPLFSKKIMALLIVQKYITCKIWGSHTDWFWDVASCSQPKVNRRFGGTCRLQIQSRRISQRVRQRESGIIAGEGGAKAGISWYLFHSGFLFGLFLLRDEC